jgi:hypothetical protein
VCCIGIGGGVCVCVVEVVSETRRLSQFTVAFIDWTDDGCSKAAAHRERHKDVGREEVLGREVGAVHSFWVCVPLCPLANFTRHLIRRVEIVPHQNKWNLLERQLQF